MSIFNLQEWHQNTWNCKSLFQQVFIVFKTFSRGIKAKNLPRTTRFCLWSFMKVFYKTTTCPRRPLLSGPKSARLIQVWLYQKRCRILIKAEILPSHFTRHLQGHFFFRKLSLKYAFGSSNTKLKLLVILVGFPPVAGKVL